MSKESSGNKIEFQPRENRHTYANVQHTNEEVRVNFEGGNIFI